jgi:hypothetical protein
MGPVKGTWAGGHDLARTLKIDPGLPKTPIYPFSPNIPVYILVHGIFSAIIYPPGPALSMILEGVIFHTQRYGECLGLLICFKPTNHKSELG